MKQSGEIAAQKVRDKEVELLECTLRDGSYAIDFKFTERDTSVLAGLLSRLGFKWIEVGHGVGLSAADKGKGKMPLSDEAAIRAAKSASGKALTGVFCIPGIATIDSLKSARDAGLDFVRIGANATEIEAALPYVEKARSIGLIPFLNFMKTYAITPEEFAKKAKAAVESGVEVVYCVDSSGSMFPEDVCRYFSALKEKCHCKMGFHAHNNLQLAVANAMQAYRCGVTFIDTTLYGIGRSAGNVPTEVAVAVFDRMGVSTGVDLFDVLDAAELYMQPLMSKIQMYDMLGVVMGYSRFHSSFLPKVKKAARTYNIDLRRLIVQMARINPVNVDDKELERVASSLPKAGKKIRDDVLVSFAAPDMTRDKIHTSPNAVATLIDAILVTSTKQNSVSAIELVPAVSPSGGLVLADLIISDDEMTLGRVTFGSYEILRDVLRLAREGIKFFLLNYDGGSWASAFLDNVLKEVDIKRIIPVYSRSLIDSYVADIVSFATTNRGDDNILIYGNCSQLLLNSISRIFKHVFVYGTERAKDRLPANCDLLSDLCGFEGNLYAVLYLCQPSLADAKSVTTMLNEEGIVVASQNLQFAILPPSLADRVIQIDYNEAYRGFMRRAMSVMRATEGKERGYEGS